MFITSLDVLPWQQKDKSVKRCIPGIGDYIYNDCRGSANFEKRLQNEQRLIYSCKLLRTNK